MIATLMRQDPAARNLPVFALAGILVGLLFRGLASPLMTDPSALTSEARGWLTFSAGLVWFTSMQLVLSVNFMTRSSRLALALPIRSRTVWWSRMASLLYTGTVPLLMATLVVSLKVSAETGGPTLDPRFLLIGGKAWAGVMLATALFQSPWPSLQRIRPGVDFVVYVVCLGLLVLLLVLILPASPITILVLLALAAALILRLHLTVPDAFLLQLTEPEEPDWVPPEARPSSPAFDPDFQGAETATTPTVATESTAGATPLDLDGEIPERGLTHWTLFRLLVNHWQTWLIMPLTGFYAFLLVESYYDGRDPFPNLLFITIWPIILTYQGIIRLHRVDHLPVARRTILPYIILPSLLAVLLGLAVGWLITTPERGGRCHVCYGEGELQVAPEYWEIAWGGKAPEIGSPWGESLVPRTRQVFPGSRIAVYLPYQTSEESSPRFLALQVNRAIAAVHGDPLFSEEEIADDPTNPLVETMSRREEQDEGFPLEGSLGRGAPVKKRAWLLGGLAVGGIWTLMTFLLMLQHRPSVYRWVYKVLYLSVIIVWGGALILYILADLLGFFDPMMSARFFYILLRRLAEQVPLGAPALVLLNFLGLGLGYLLILMAFRGLEAPLGKVKPIWKEYG